MGFTHSGFFVLRTPLLPFETVSRWSDSAHDSLDAGEVTPDSFDTHWRSEVAILRDRLAEVVQRPEIRLALHLASPTLENSIDAWISQPDTKKGLQTERSLIRYVFRMAARSTPFGLFSGCSVGPIVGSADNGASDLRVAPQSRYVVRSKLDYASLFALTEDLNHDERVVEQLSYKPNSSLHKVGGSWHYLESRVVASLPTHSLLRVLGDPYFECAVSAAETGASIEEISQAIIALSKGELARDEVRTYIHELIGSQILISSLQPNVTGRDPITDISEQLSGLRQIDGHRGFVDRLRTEVERLGEKGLSATPSDYRGLPLIGPSGQHASGHPVACQLDLFKPLTGGLSDIIAKHLSEAVHLLRSLGVAPPDPKRKLAGFRVAFRDRYGQSLVPLAEVLNDDVGIGVDGKIFEGCSSLLADIPRGEPNQDGSANLTEFHKMLLEKVLASAHTGDTEIELTLSDGERYKPVISDLPAAFSVTATMVASSCEDISSGNFSLWMRAAAGPSGVTAMGRFCHAVPGLEDYVREHIRREEALDSEAVFAEIAYLPVGRSGNILYRPLLRDYEIEYLGRSGALPVRQIAIGDLFVTVTDQDQIVLFSKRLGKRIIPRLTSAHTFNKPQLPPIYRFLCYLQYEHWKAVPSFDWGPLDSLSFLPRLRAGKVILSPARWKISNQEIEAIAAAKRRSDIFLEVQALRRRRKLPKWICLAEADQLLPVDLDNVLSVDAFAQVLKRSETATIEEMIYDPRDMPIANEDGRFQHEVVVPFVYDTTNIDKVSDQPERTTRITAIEPQSFSIYSEWLYLKIYGGTGVLDEFVREGIPSIVGDAFAEEMITSWFFLRYDDPKPHVRLRFHGRPDVLSSKLLPLIHKAIEPMLVSRQLYQTQLDSYQPEVDRYGGLSGLRIAEKVFWADSEAVVRLLGAAQHITNEASRWELALVGVHRLLEDCLPLVKDRISLLDELRNGLFSEFDTPPQTKMKMAETFRRLRRPLESMTSDLLHFGEGADGIRTILEQRSKAIQSSIAELWALQHKRELCRSIHSIVASYIHMHTNRVLRDEGRLQEMIIYDYLFHLYVGRQSRLLHSV